MSVQTNKLGNIQISASGCKEVVISATIHIRQ